MADLWNGFACKTIVFEEREAIIVFPEKEKANGALALKTEYWNAFPQAAEIGLLERGFHLCCIQNTNRWGTDDNLDRQARFVRYVQAQYGLSGKCVPIGMSCGGLIAVKLAARYPELTCCLYLDAPVINYMSCPCGFGVGRALNSDPSEILGALGMSSIGELLAYREMPLDKLGELIAHRIPIVLVAGDSDSAVPFCENGAFVQKAYKDSGIDIEVYIKPGCGHHPHGLENPVPVIDFICRHSL